MLSAWNVWLTAGALVRLPFPPSTVDASGAPSAHRAVTFILLCKFPVVVVVESWVGLHGLLLTQVLVLVLDTVHGSTGNLRGEVRGSEQMSPVDTSARGSAGLRRVAPLQPSFLRANLLAGSLRLMENN